MSRNRIDFPVFLLSFFIVCCVNSCIKAPIDFADTDSGSGDPNIIFLDDTKVDIATYKVDSFITSGKNVVMVGEHLDPVFGKIVSSAYAEVHLPTSNVIKDLDVTFDSISLIIKPDGSYYGDTLKQIDLSIHRLKKKIKNEDDALAFYQPAAFAFDSNPLGTIKTILRPNAGKLLHIRLDDDWGRELLDKLQNDDDDIVNNESFVNYFNGVILRANTSVNNTIFYFSPDSGTNIIRLYYHINSAFPQEKYLDLNFEPSKQFIHISADHSGTALSVFPIFKNKLIKSSETAGRAYLHNNIGTSIKISFPEILKLKELYPYINIMKAELIVYPTPGTYSYPYELPDVVPIYTTDDNHLPILQLSDPVLQGPLTGNLFIDKLFGQNTKYTYNITGFIRNLLAEGVFSESALLLVPQNGTGPLGVQRLVINEQGLNKGIELKLYVLGL